MAGSVAEERIRAKVEAEFRRRWPDARIVHELVLTQGGVRIDLAAITEDALIVAEIKSERDVLKRLPDQVTAALRVSQCVWVVVADKHAAEVKRRSGWGEADKIDGLGRCILRGEAEDGSLQPIGYDGRNLSMRFLTGPGEMLHMLWAAELRRVTERLGSGPRTTRLAAIQLAVEHLTGAEIRRAVCAALRRRSFPRADVQPDAHVDERAALRAAAPPGMNPESEAA